MAYLATGSNNHILLIRSGWQRHGQGGQEGNGVAVNVDASGTTNTPTKFSLNFDGGSSPAATAHNCKVYAQVYGVMS